MLKRVAAVLVMLLACGSLSWGAEYFVSKNGNDANNGFTKDAAFLTVQKGVNAIQAGDKLTIGPGEYLETVTRADLGNMNVDTIISAEVPGTVVLRGDMAIPPLQKVEGRRFVHAVSFDEEPAAILEHDTLRMLMKRPDAGAAEYEPGTFAYDSEKKMLYVSPSDLRAAGIRRYTAAVNDTHGFTLTNPKRVIVDGLAATGFYPNWGILLNSPVSCTVRNCVLYMNTGGVCLDDGSDNLVENCVCYGNTFGGIVRNRANNDVIRNCRTFKNGSGGDEHFGIMHYFEMTGPLLIKDNISWGHNFNFSVKPSQQERLENCISLGSVRNAKMFHNIIGGGNEYDKERTTTADNILFMREENLDKDFEFADPMNLDFRLQSDSHFRGAAPDGSDSGPFPYKDNIHYVSPTGDDNADGLSMRTAWKTLQKGVSAIKPGDTLYLAEGEYETVLPVTNLGNEDSITRICGRGRGTIVIRGVMKISENTAIAFERLTFGDPVMVSNSREVTLNNCNFAAGMTTSDVAGLNVTHSVFANEPLVISASERVTLTGNIYANQGKPAVQIEPGTTLRYSDYNAYQDTAGCWQDGVISSLDQIRPSHDVYSRAWEGELASQDGVVTVADAPRFGPGSSALGNYYDYDASPSTLELVGPLLHSTSATTANIEWYTSRPATFELAWGETPELANVVSKLKAPECFTTYSLTGLKPGTKYYFAVRSAASDSTETLKPEQEPLSFTTAAAAQAPVTYYVATTGDDNASGLSREQAWRTVSHAADTVRPGDTVIIAGGEYHECIRIRTTGDEGKPITFRCATGEKVVFNGRNLLRAFKIVAKKNLRFDGFYFEYFGDSMGAVFELWHGDNVQITRCLNVRGTGNISFIAAEYSSDVLVKNCVMAGGFAGASFLVCPNWRMENNLIIRPLIDALYFVNEPDDKGYFNNNIVTDDLPYKVNGPLIDIGRFESFVEKDNCYFLRRPDEQRKMFCFYGTLAYGRYKEDYGVRTEFETPPIITDNPDGTENNPRFSLKEYQAIAGDTGSYAGDPKMAGTLNMEEGGKLWTGDPAMLFDKLMNDDLDFPATFATAPEAVAKKIGPQPDDFKDFWFNKK